ncbi:type I-E CRISPR-associated protein Cse1/CasA [Paralcaligenes ginsengisoli]
MNLYRDAWIPVCDIDAKFQLISLKQLLCQNGAWQISISRDDMELACLQLLVSLVQVAFTPDDEKEWRHKIHALLDESTFNAGVTPLLGWFDLDHPVHPFMQMRGVKSAEATPIQKLLVGLPEGNNHTFFNAPGEVSHLGEPMAAIALFNQASNTPSFGGGFKGGLRGTPVTTLIAGDDLRQIIWRNVLHADMLLRAIPWYAATKNQPPSWVERIKSGDKIQINQIGLLRGLFWQPNLVELIPANTERSCDVLQGEVHRGYSGFNKEKFVFEVSQLWPHPHSPREFEVKKEGRIERFLGFTTTAPAWTRCNHFLFDQLGTSQAKEGSNAAAVVTQWRESGTGNLYLIVGGYRNKQASILQRRHESLSIGEGWQNEKGQQAIEWAIRQALAVKKLLRGRLYGVVKGNRDKGLKALGADIHELGEIFFYQRTENLILTWLKEMTRTERREEKAQFIVDLSQICRKIFEEVTDPYCQNLALIRTVALAKRGLNFDLEKLKESTAR